jgi:hypothetical protein
MRFVGQISIQKPRCRTKKIFWTPAQLSMQAQRSEPKELKKMCLFRNLCNLDPTPLSEFDNINVFPEVRKMLYFAFEFFRIKSTKKSFIIFLENKCEFI